MKKYTISLSYQCNQNWDKMDPQENGRHCSSCNKVVIDFSVMKDEEIIQYLLKNKNSCGRFQQNQLNRPVIVYNHRKKSNWPAIAAMLIAGFVSVVPHTLNATGEHLTKIEFLPVEGEQRTPKTEPDKAGNFNFTIRLFKTSDKSRILYGTAYINNLGTYTANPTGDICIQINNQDIPEVITIAISTSGYGYHEYKINKKELKNSTGADLYFDEVQMTAGVVAIKEH